MIKYVRMRLNSTITEFDIIIETIEKYLQGSDYDIKHFVTIVNDIFVRHNDEKMIIDILTKYFGSSINIDEIIVEVMEFFTSPKQIIEFIDYSVMKYYDKSVKLTKFMNLARELSINENLDTSFWSHNTDFVYALKFDHVTNKCNIEKTSTDKLESLYHSIDNLLNNEKFMTYILKISAAKLGEDIFKSILKPDFYSQPHMWNSCMRSLSNNVLDLITHKRDLKFFMQLVAKTEIEKNHWIDFISDISLLSNKDNYKYLWTLTEDDGEICLNIYTAYIDEMVDNITTDEYDEYYFHKENIYLSSYTLRSSPELLEKILDKLCEHHKI